MPSTRAAGEVPVGGGDLGVTQVSRQRQHRLINIGSLRVPQHHAANSEAVAQVVDARPIVAATVHPIQRSSQFDEDPVDLAPTQGMAQPLSSCADEER